jgi:TolA-binding protein
LNLPPLFSSRQEHGQHVLLSQNVPYDYPAPPDIPYAESAASAASSNLSPPEDESGPKGPVDEEKRRRNLAASARFRQKKKLREQQLEHQTKELTDRATELEEKMAELQKENDFLKALLTEKETDMTPEGRRKFHEFALLVEHGEY